MGLVPWQATVTNETKQVVPNPVVTVRNVSDDTLATLYSDAAGTSEVNPITGDANGFVQFWAQPGEYYIDGAKDGEVADRWYWDAVDLSVTQPYDTRADAEAALADLPSAVVSVEYLDADGTKHALTRSLDAPSVWRPSLSGGVAHIRSSDCVADGVTDDVSAIEDFAEWAVTKNATIDLAGLVVGLGSTYVFKDGVSFQNGAFKRVGADYHTLLMSENFLDLVDTTDNGGLTYASFKNITLDGDWLFADESASDPIGEHDGSGLLYYGTGLNIDGLFIKSLTSKSRGSRGKGLHNEYRGNSSPFDHSIKRLLINGVGRTGWVSRAADTHANGVVVRGAGRANEKVGGESVYDHILALSAFVLDTFNTWQPSSGVGSDNVRAGLYVDGPGTLVKVTGGTFAHSALAGLYTSPSTRGCLIGNVNVAILRANDAPLIWVNGGQHTMQLSARPGDVVTAGPLLRIGTSGSPAENNDIKIMSRDLEFAELIDFAASDGGNRIQINGRTTSFTPLKTGTPHVSDIIEENVSGGGLFADSMTPRNLTTIDIETTDATPSSSGYVMPQNTSWHLTGTITARQVAGSGSGRRSWTVDYMFSRSVAASTVSVVAGSPGATVGASNSATSWDAELVANTSTGGVDVVVTGEADKTIRWIADIRCVEIRS